MDRIGPPISPSPEVAESVVITLFALAVAIPPAACSDIDLGHTARGPESSVFTGNREPMPPETRESPATRLPTCRDFYEEEWRDPDLNRGHHDFQASGVAGVRRRKCWKRAIFAAPDCSASVPFRGRFGVIGPRIGPLAFWPRAQGMGSGGGCISASLGMANTASSPVDPNRSIASCSSTSF